MAEYANTITTEASSEDKSTDIRATMSVSNLLTPPSHNVDVPDPSTPVATAPSAPADAPVTPQAAATDIKEAPSSSLASDIARLDHDMDVESSPIAAGASAAPVEREFECKNDDYAECQTGQYTIALSRKVISDHFGRNKSCTKVIKDWPLFCRKHYQRATYNSDQWQARKLQLVLRQFKIIEEQFPGTMYTVALKKSEEDRLNLYSRKVASGMDNEDAAEFVVPRTNKHFEAPIDTLRELAMDLGADKTLEEVEQTVHNITNMLELGETKQVPSIEFLPQLNEHGNTWTMATGGSPRKGKSPKTSRVNRKGGVQKPATPKKAKAKA